MKSTKNEQFHPIFHPISPPLHQMCLIARSNTSRKFALTSCFEPQTLDLLWICSKLRHASLFLDLTWSITHSNWQKFVTCMLTFLLVCNQFWTFLNQITWTLNVMWQSYPETELKIICWWGSLECYIYRQQRARQLNTEERQVHRE